MQTGLLDRNTTEEKMMMMEEKKKRKNNNNRKLVLQASIRLEYGNIVTFAHTYPLHVNPKPNYHNSTMVQYKLLPLFNQVLQSFFLYTRIGRAQQNTFFLFFQKPNRPSRNRRKDNNRL